MRILRGYHKPIVALAVSPNGTRLYTAAHGHTQIWQWHLADGTVERKLRGGHLKEIRALACSPDGRLLLSAEPSLGVFAWSLADGTSRPLPRRPAERSLIVGDLVIHPGSRLAAASRWETYDLQPYGVQLWDLDGDELPRVLTWRSGCTSALAFSPSGELLAAALSDLTVRLWDHERGEEVQSLPQKEPPLWLAFRPDGKVLVVGAENRVHAWDLSRGVTMKISGEKLRIVALAYSPDGKCLAIASRDGIIRLYDAATNEPIGQRHLEIGKLGAASWLPDSSGLVAGGDKLIAVCEVAELLGTEHASKKARGEPLSLAGHQLRIEGLRYSPDGRALLSWARDGQRLWDLSGGAGQAKPATEFATDVTWNLGGASWSPDGLRLALWCGFSARIVDSRSGAILDEVPRGDGSMHLTFTPAGRLFRASMLRKRLELLDGQGEDRALLYSAEIGREPHEIGTTHFPRRDDRHLYVVVRPGDVHRWTPLTGDFVCLFRQRTVITHLTVSPDEQWFLTTAGTTATLRRLGDRQALELKHPLTCSGAAFLPGGRLLTACFDGIVRVWDATGGTELYSFDLGMGRVTCLATSPDFMTFAAGVEKQSRIVLMDVPE